VRPANPLSGACCWDESQDIREGMCNVDGILFCGASMILRHARAQKAYAPWASLEGAPPMPPS
jgi:hypothetical protein